MNPDIAKLQSFGVGGDPFNEETLDPTTGLNLNLGLGTSTPSAAHGGGLPGTAGSGAGIAGDAAGGAAGAGGAGGPGGNKSGTFIHIRLHQRSGRKKLTTVQGLPDILDSKKLLKAWKKEFACNGTVVEDPDMGEVIQLQGDQRANVKRFLVSKPSEKEDAIAVEGMVKIHGG